MNMDYIEGSWMQLKGNIKLKLGRYFNDQFFAMEGRREQLAGEIQAAYGNMRGDSPIRFSVWQQQQENKLRACKQH